MTAMRREELAMTTAESLEEVRKMLTRRPSLARFEIHREDRELHLVEAGESFVRLIPTETAGTWRMEYFHNLEEWRVIDYRGSLEECLDFLHASPHYRFWEG